MLIPKVKLLPSEEILIGRLSFRVDIPPLMDKIKSSVSNTPVAPDVLKTSSLIVITMALLSFKILMFDIVEGVPS